MIFKNQMDFKDLPNMARFERHALARQDCPVTLDAYRRAKEILNAAPKPPTGMSTADPIKQIEFLAASCKAVEKSTRVIWACASATDFVAPPIWDYLPDYQGALEYFNALPDLDIMALTEKHRLKWDQVY
jgi:hypothetical protein